MLGNADPGTGMGMVAGAGGLPGLRSKGLCRDDLPKACPHCGTLVEPFEAGKARSNYDDARRMVHTHVCMCVCVYVPVCTLMLPAGLVSPQEWWRHCIADLPEATYICCVSPATSQSVTPRFLSSASCLLWYCKTWVTHMYCNHA